MLLALFAQVESDILSEGAGKRVVVARVLNGKLERPKGALDPACLVGWEEGVRRFHGLGVSRTVISRATRLSRSAPYDVMQSLGQGTDRQVAIGTIPAGVPNNAMSGEGDG